MSDVINNQPSIIRNLITFCTKQTSADGTVSYFLAQRLLVGTIEGLKAAASVNVKTADGYHCRKDGKDYSWSLRITKSDATGAMCHFVFIDVTESKRK